MNIIVLKSSALDRSRIQGIPTTTDQKKKIFGYRKEIVLANECYIVVFMFKPLKEKGNTHYKCHYFLTELANRKYSSIPFQTFRTSSVKILRWENIAEKQTLLIFNNH